MRRLSLREDHRPNGTEADDPDRDYQILPHGDSSLWCIGMSRDAPACHRVAQRCATMHAALTFMTMQRLCQTTGRCGTSKNARMRSVAAVAAGWRTEGDEDLVSTSRQVSACRHGLDKRCPVVLSVLEGLRASGQGERWLELPLMPFPWKGACSDPEFQKEPWSCVTHMSTMGCRRVGQMLVPVTFVGRSALGAQRGGAGAGRRAHTVCLAYPPGRDLSPAFDRPPRDVVVRRRVGRGAPPLP
jgi:hypothetical protein